MLAMFRRLYAMLLRQIFLIKRSPPRLISLIFWPTINMVIWGYLNKYLFTHSQLVGFTLSTLLGATLMANFFERSNMNTMLSFLEDFWARNLGNVVITPLRPLEMVGGYVLTGFVNVMIGVGTACVIGYFLFDYSIFEIGVGLIPFLLNLVVSGWCVGTILVCVVIRFGVGGEYFGWMLAVLLIPFVAVYYPVSVLPTAMQYVSWALPPTYIFEALREYIATGVTNWGYVQKAALLNLFYLALTVFAFTYNLNKVRQKNGLLGMDAS